MSIFGVPWDELSLEHVEAFLAAAGTESLTWDAKGTQLPRPDSVAKHVCGFANSVDGGYLLIGVQRDSEGAWDANGVDFPNDDPPVWVSGVVSTLRPRPRVDVRGWPVKEKRVAVVRIDPVAEPPCMTRGGQVFERVSGATVPVTDPTELVRLFGRGEAAAARARRDAEAVADERVGHDFVRQGHFVLVVSAAAVSYPPGIDARLFTPETKESLSQRSANQLRPNRYVNLGGARIASGIGGLVALLASNQPTDKKWTVALARSGAVSVTGTIAESETGTELLMEDVVRPAWSVASEFVERLGGSGRTAVHVRTLGQIRIEQTTGIIGELRPTSIDEWTAEPNFKDDEFQVVRRHLIRSAGIEEWEPSASRDV